MTFPLQVGKAYRDRSDNKWHAIGESVFSPGWMLLESENGARHACRISDGTWGGRWNPQDIIGLWGEPVPCTRPIIKHKVRLRNGEIGRCEVHFARLGRPERFEITQEIALSFGVHGDGSFCGPDDHEPHKFDVVEVLEPFE